MKLQCSLILLSLLVILSCIDRSTRENNKVTKTAQKESKKSNEGEGNIYQLLIAQTSLTKADVRQIRRIETSYSIKLRRLRHADMWEGGQNRATRQHWRKAKNQELRKVIGRKKYIEYVNGKAKIQKDSISG